MKRERPDVMTTRPASGSSIFSWLPSGSLRTMSCNRWAGAVAAPSASVMAGASSTTSSSRSVAVSLSVSP